MTFGVSSYVLTSEMVKNSGGDNSTRVETAKIVETQPKEVIMPSDVDEELFAKKLKEVGFEDDASWKNYGKQAIKNCL